MEITLGHTYRWHATNEIRYSILSLMDNSIIKCINNLWIFKFDIWSTGRNYYIHNHV